MIQIQVLKKLLDLDAMITTATLNNYEKWGLISKPERQNLGRGGGIITTYAPEAAAEAYASWFLMRGAVFKDLKASPETVAEARKIALHIENSGYSSKNDVVNDKELGAMVIGKGIQAFLALEWLKVRNRILYGNSEALFEEIKQTQEMRDRAAKEGMEKEADELNEKLAELWDERKRRFFIERLSLNAVLLSEREDVDNLDEWEDRINEKYPVD